VNTTEIARLKRIAAELAPLSASTSGSALTPQGLNVADAQNITNELIWYKENPPAPEIIRVEVPVTPPPPPVLPPPVKPGAMPVGDLPGWKQVYAEDFTKPAALGQVGTVYGTNVRGYSGFTDTSKKGTYDPDKVLSVPEGSSYLDFWLRTVDGKPRIACPVPMGYTGQTYGRFAMRMRSDQIAGYKVAFMQWPKSNNWAEGEIDYPEFDLTGTIGGYDHDVTGNPSKNTMWASTKVTAVDWHELVMEWTPESVTFLLDGAIIGTTNKAAGGVPTKPMRWTLQAETKLDSTPVPASAAGHLQIDWLTAYTYVPR
jgi:hypothetical protein